GHIENLGLYELLKRECALIIVIDAEQDPSLACGSLNDAERFARIDLGIRIELPWETIRDGATAVDDVMRTKGRLDADFKPSGPHVAVGRIHYPNGPEGTIVYVKS